MPTSTLRLILMDGLMKKELGAFYEFKSISEYKKEDLPLISILIRTCNRPEFFREALKSAIFQTWPNLEIVVVEDGSFSAQSICQGIHIFAE